MSGGGGGPHGVTLGYENVRIAITNGKITVSVNSGTDKEKTVVMNQKTGEVE